MTQKIDLGLRVPRYQQLAQRLADGIAREDYPVGSLLPGEEELCRRFKMSRFTVREALRHLQETGMVSRRQGIGTTVIARQPARELTQSIGSIEQVQQYAVSTRLIDHRYADVAADQALAEAFGCDQGAPLLRIEALRVSDEALPIAWTVIHLVGAYAGIRERVASHKGAIGALVEQLYDETITAISQHVRAVSIPADIARKLDVPENTPGLKVDRAYFGRDGRCFELASSIHPGSRFSLSMLLQSRKVGA